MTMPYEFLGDRFCQSFRQGFYDAAPVWYTSELEAGSACKWCEPWTWADSDDWHDPELTAREMGERWADMNAERMQILFDEAEENARRQQEAEAEAWADACLA